MFAKRKLVFLFLFLSIVTTGYVTINKSSVAYDYYFFIGDGKHWKIEYEARTIFEKRENQVKGTEVKYKFTYKGELSELLTMKNLYYSYEGLHGSVSHEIPYDNPIDKNFFTNEYFTSFRVVEDDIILVEIVWHGEFGGHEIIELTFIGTPK